MDDLPAESPSDAELLVRYRAGDPNSFSLLYRKYNRPLYYYLRSMTGDPGSAEDLVQEAYLKLLEADPASLRDTLRSLLYTAARHLAIDHARRKSVRRSSVPVLEISPGSAPQASRELAETVSSALGKLPDEQREVVVLKVYADLSFAEIARLIGAPSNTVMSRYRYALSKLGSALGPEGDRHE